jgi:isomerase DpgB
MSIAFIEFEERTIAKVEIDGAAVLSNGLSRQVDYALDQAEDLGPSAVLFIHVVGCVDKAACNPWPGPIETQAVTKWERMLRRIERASFPTFTLVQHACSAVALELLLVADRRLASHDFSVQQYECPGGGIWPGMGLYRLSRQIGDARARKLFLDDINLSASRSVEFDIVDETVDDLGNGLARIKHLLKHAPLDDFAVRRRLMQDSISASFDDALGAHLAACDRALRRTQTKDCAVAVPAGKTASEV